MGVPLACTSAPWASFPFCDSTLPTAARIEDALSRMPLHEKINAMYRDFGSPFVTCAGNTGIPSLGINGGLPNYSECLHGVASGCTTVNGTKLCPTLFPNGALLGATWNRTLFAAVGRVIGEELRALNNLAGQPSGYSCWSPNLNLARDPRWGRNQEVPGEDPFLTAEYGVHYVQGMMVGKDSRYVLTAASPKHFLAYNSEGLGPNNETGLCTADKGTWYGAVGYADGGVVGPNGHVCRYGYNNVLTDRDLVEYYLPAWNAVVVRGGALGFMCSYTATNGVPSCASEWAMEELMREQWGFDGKLDSPDSCWSCRRYSHPHPPPKTRAGYVVTDCLALQVMMQAHEYIPYDIPLAAAIALEAGVSYNCGCVLRNGTEAAIARGLINETLVDEAVRRTLGVLYKLGEFDLDVPYRSYGVEQLDTPSHRALALESALQGLVLLKNSKGVLPLSPTAKIAFIGPAADRADIMASSYGGDNDLINSHTPILAAQAAGLSVTLTHGCDINNPDASGFPAAVAAAVAADVAVLFLGTDFAFESEWGNGPDCQNDRPYISLPGVQERLIAAVVATGKPVVVVLMNGGGIGVQAWDASVDTIVEAFYPGELGGDAIVAALTGANRWGALPFTMYPNAIVSRDYYSPESAQLQFAGGITHMYYDGALGAPTYPFGWGESYTTFEFAWAEELGPSVTVHPDVPLAIHYRCNVTNVGPVAGDAIVQAYVAGPSPDYPLERLWNFARVSLAPGETTEVSFVASGHDMSGVREDGSRRLRVGDALTVTLGSRRSPLVHSFTLLDGGAGDVSLPVFPGPGGAKTLRNTRSR
jgi:beta-glucosidase-like glycosyl hydrolase